MAGVVTETASMAGSPFGLPLMMIPTSNVSAWPKMKRAHELLDSKGSMNPTFKALRWCPMLRSQFLSGAGTP